MQQKNKKKEKEKAKEKGKSKLPYAAVLGSLLKQNDDDQALSMKERREHANEKQIQIAFQETEFQPQFWVGPTTIKVWLIFNQTLINGVLL